VKLLLDMNLSPRWAEALGEAGFEAVHWSAVGSGGATDVEILTGLAGTGSFCSRTISTSAGFALSPARKARASSR
jgi:hypothetical protein